MVWGKSKCGQGWVGELQPILIQLAGEGQLKAAPSCESLGLKVSVFHTGNNNDNNIKVAVVCVCMCNIKVLINHIKSLEN